MTSKDNDDINFSDLIRLLDKCIVSDKDSIKKALRELLVVVALSEKSDDDKPGPLTTLVETVQSLEIKMMDLQRQIRKLESNMSYGQAIGTRPNYDSYTYKEWIKKDYDQTIDPSIYKKIKGWDMK